MSKSDQLKQALLQRGKARKGIYDDFEGLRAFLEAAIEEAREERAKSEKERAHAKS